jgi:uncharacterized protein (TIGR02996 family)
MMISGEVSLSQEQAFLADICAHPDDDGARLVFADWLTERDGPGDKERAEFIRVQIELAGVLQALEEDGLTDSGAAVVLTQEVQNRLERADYLVEREDALLGDDVGTGQGIWPRWMRWCDEDGINDRWVQVPGFGNVGRLERASNSFRRGFVEHIVLPAADWCRYAERLRATQPICEVTLTTRLDIWLCAHPEKPGFAYLYPCQGDSSPLWTVPLVDWIGTKYNPAGEGESRGQVQVLRARWLWPGILFHGPDFPEGKS